jgi:uncharacterized Zn finger protein
MPESEPSDGTSSPVGDVETSDPCPRCGTELSQSDLRGIASNAGVSAIARCGDCGLMWSPSLGWYGEGDC